MFASPRIVSSLEDCRWYHSMDLPGWGTVEGDWDLRGTIDRYLGGMDFAGKRVLEIGPASGYFTFEMERRGASVVSVELPDNVGWNFVPYPEQVLAPIRAARPETMRRLQNSWWLAHRAYQSKALLHYGDAHQLPDALGHFDIAIMASVLLHAHSPLQIVHQCAQRADALVIVDNLFPDVQGPVCELMATADNNCWGTWWKFSPELFTQYLGVMGFGDVRQSTHEHLYQGNPLSFFTVTGRRDRHDR